jgi:hypothetical protein
VGSAPLRHVREARVDDPSLFKPGQAITVGLFARDDIIDITGTSKGKGFAGVMKRHGFKGFTATHGTHESKRGGGSIGQSADPAKVFKNMKMPGQMGDEVVTVQNLRIVDIREDQNLLMIKGPVPGAKNGLLVISHAIKKEAPPLREIETAPEEPDIEPDLSEVEGETSTDELSAEELPTEKQAEATEDKPAEEAVEATEKAAEETAQEEGEETAPETTEEATEEAVGDADAKEADEEKKED